MRQVPGSAPTSRMHCWPGYAASMTGAEARLGMGWKHRVFAIYFVAARAYFSGTAGLFIVSFPWLCLAQGSTENTEVLTPLSSGPDSAAPPPWRVVGLPGHKTPLTLMDMVTLDSGRVLRLRTERSYGTLTHAVPAQTQAGILRWRWRLEQAMPSANLQRKDGDDAPLKVCALFDLPLESIPLFDRTLLRLARSISGEPLPAATLCYVWDHQLSAGTELANAYTRRMRWVVLDSGTQNLGHWVTHTRDLRADFLRNFGAESDTVPPLLAIVVGADSDNTGSTSLGYVGDVSLMKQ